jgi:hypothetical protein
LDTLWKTNGIWHTMIRQYKHQFGGCPYRFYQTIDKQMISNYGK